VLLIAINLVLRPLSRYIDQRSLAALDTHTLYRLRLFCDQDHQVDAEYQITRAIAARSLVLRQIRSDEVEDTGNAVVLAILESASRDSKPLETMIEELRAFPWTRSIEWTETAAEAE
jgi:putative Mg2+ transporter-C (MgtC) family protein